MLKKDYATLPSAYLKGRQLDKAIDGLLAGLVNAAQHVATNEDIKQYMQEVEIPKEYL